MTTRSRGSRTLAGALVTVDNLTQQPKAIAFQYNPATLQRTLQPQMVGGEEGDRYGAKEPNMCKLTKYAQNITQTINVVK